MLIEEPEAQLIYLAGIIDGEGQIRITTNKKKRGDKIYTWNTPVIMIANTHKPLMDWILDNFGGGYYMQQKQEEHYKNGYQWSISGENAILLGKRLEPYLIVKQGQLKRILDYDKDLSIQQIRLSLYNGLS